MKGVGAEAGSGLESLGSKLSLLAWVDVFRIDIVVGELARDRRHQNNKGKGMKTPYYKVKNDMYQVVHYSRRSCVVFEHRSTNHEGIKFLYLILIY